MYGGHNYLRVRPAAFLYWQQNSHRVSTYGLYGVCPLNLNRNPFGGERKGWSAYHHHTTTLHGYQGVHAKQILRSSVISPFLLQWPIFITVCGQRGWMKQASK